MPTKTLLDYTQDILSALDSDEVQSISDTVESLQVARIVRRAWEHIVLRADLSEHYTMFQLTASGDATKPTLMYRPSDVDTIEWIKYDVQTDDDNNVNYQLISFLPPEEFIRRNTMLNEDDDNVGTFTHIVSSWMTDAASDEFTFKYTDDNRPQWYTCFDDKTLIFDSYDADVDTTLQNSKTLVYGKKDQLFSMDDDFVPLIDPDFVSLLENEAMVLAFAELKQIPHEVATKWATRSWSKMLNNKRGVDNKHKPFDDLPNYGRKR
jgi:hypothetical protein